MSLAFDHYCKYDELTEYVKEVAAKHPELVSLSSMGSSWEGRKVWLLTITNLENRAPGDKPAMYIDGNIHAGEVTGSMVCLYTIGYLVENYDSDEEVTWLLDNRTFYIAPRVNPDGAELYLTTPYMLRSSVRPYPDALIADLPGLHPEDIDGDGWILLMRKRDDAGGEWKVSSRDPRLMVPRRPDDRHGPFYRMMQEGYVSEFEGEPFQVHNVPWGLDLNRNFPSNWSPKLRGGGHFPASEPEVKNIVDFILAHSNIGALQAFHTTGGIIFRGPYVYPDKDMDREDYRALITIVQRGTELTGYPDVSSFGGPYAATIVDWAYEHRGILGYTTELWDMLGRAGVERPDYSSHRPPDPKELEELGLSLLEWNDRELAGTGFFDWRAFDHPQLGEIELGGWNPKFVRQNPPPKFLEQECHKNMLFTFKHAAALPQVEFSSIDTEAVEEGLVKLTVTVRNRGYLPTNLTNKAKEVNAVRPDRLELAPGEGVAVAAGNIENKLGFIEGYMQGQGGGPWRVQEPAASVKRQSWLLSFDADRGTTPPLVDVIIRSEKGGTVRRRVALR